MGIRCFTALFFDPSVTDAVHRIGHELRRDFHRLEVPEPRWERPANLHCTVNFFGDCSPGQIAAIVTQTRRAWSPLPLPPATDVGALGVFPNTRSPRVLWAGCTDQAGTFQWLYALVADIARREGIAVEDRSYVPHITLGRWKSLVNTRTTAERLDELLHHQSISLATTVSELYFMESVQSNAGSEYRVLEKVALTA